MLCSVDVLTLVSHPTIFYKVYYESIKREPKIRGIKKCRCDERLQTKTKEFTLLPYTGLVYDCEKIERSIFFFFKKATPEDQPATPQVLKHTSSACRAN
jgi:hypothetical protein